jgi:hypothetical protein
MSKNSKTQDQTPNNPSSQQPQRTQIQPNRKNTHTTDQLQKKYPITYQYRIFNQSIENPQKSLTIIQPNLIINHNLYPK